MIMITLYSEWIHALCLPPGSLQITQWFVMSPVLALLHLYISVVSKQKYYGILPSTRFCHSFVFLPEMGHSVSEKNKFLVLILGFIVTLHGQVCKYKSYGSFSCYLYNV